MKKLVIFFSTLLLLSLCATAFAARVDVSGVVVEASTGNPLPGANIFVQGTAAGAAADANGAFKFYVDIDREFTIIVRYMGYKSKENDYQPTDDLTNLRFELESDVFQGEAVVVTGIASKRSKSVAEVAVSRVSAAELTVANSYQDLSQMVAGKVAGVRIESGSGNVGSGIRFNVRSGGGFNGDGQPIIYVDGVRLDNSEIVGYGVGGQGVGMLADLNPEEIENIEFLKGPAAAASYGTSGSNGVVLITTKRGQFVPGKPKGISIDYKYVTGYSAPMYEYTDRDIYTYKTLNKVLKDDAPMHQHTLSAFGGTSLMKYYVGLDNRYEEGITPSNYMDRTTLRANLDIFPSEKVMLKASASYAKNMNRRPNNDNNIFGFLGNAMLTPVPYMLTDSLGTIRYKNLIRSNRFIGSVQMQYRPIENFEAQVTVGLDESDLRNDETFPADIVYSFYPAGRRAIWSRAGTQLNVTADARYTYSPLEGLSITSMVGTQIFDRKVRTYSVAKEFFLTELITNVGSGRDYTGGDEFYSHTREAGIFTDHQFSYNDIYFFSAAVRKDYASAIGVEAPSIFYPRASLAIRLDRLGLTPSLFNLFKIRAAYGETGMLPDLDDVVPLLWAAGVGGFGAGAVIDAIGNNELKPERISEIELGFETEFFTNYAFEFTYFNQKATDSIIDFNNAPSTGLTASAVPFNIGGVEGWGIETLLRAQPIRNRNFELDLSLVNSYAENEVTDMGGAQPIYDGWDVNVIKEGMPKHQFYSLKTVGALIDSATGVYLGPDVSEDRVDCGSPVPTYTGSFSVNLRMFKNFNLYLLTDWATGLSVFNNSKLFSIYYAGFFGGPNVPEVRELQEQLGLADYDNVDETPLTPGTAEYNAAAERYAHLDYRLDGNFIEEADFFKLREISISYDFTDLLPKPYGKPLVNNLTLGLSGRNLFTTTKYSGADPEINSDGSRSLSRGQDFLTLMHPKSYNAWVRISL